MDSNNSDNKDEENLPQNWRIPAINFERPSTPANISKRFRIGGINFQARDENSFNSFQLRSRLFDGRNQNDSMSASKELPALEVEGQNRSNLTVTEEPPAKKIL